MISVLFFLLLIFLPLLSSLQIHISSTSHTCTPSCDGSSANPFQTLAEALFQASSQTGTIDFLFDTSSENAYSIDSSDLGHLGAQQSNGIYYVDAGATTMTWRPENCDTNSLNCNQVNISINTESVVFEINGRLELNWIQLQGGETNGSSSQTYGLFELVGGELRIENSLIAFQAQKYSYFSLISNGTSALINITNCNFSNISFNMVLFSLNAKGSSIILENCEFTSLNISSVIFSNLNNQQITIETSQFFDFSGTFFALESGNTIQINETSFSNNFYLSSSSSPLFSLQDNNTLTLTACSFYNLSVPMAYGAVFKLATNNTFVLLSSIVKNIYGYFGGFLYALNTNIVIINSSSFSNCSTYYDGGAIYLDLYNTYSSFNNRFSNNKAFRGGAFYSNDSNIMTSTFSVYSSNRAFYLGNKEGGQGAAISLNKTSNLSLFFETLDSNSADSDGAGLCSNYSNYIYLDSTTFSLNNAGNYGGGISFTYGAEIFSKNCSFLQNNAGLWGGAAYTYSYTIILQDVYCSMNTAVHGSAWFTNMFANVIMNNMTVDKSSTAWGLGGMFYFYNGNQANITNCSFLKSNTIPWSIAWVGGVFAFDRNNSFTLRNVIIEDSLSANTGGVFYIFYLNKGYLYNVSITNSKTNNAEGGVFYIGESNYIHMEDLTSLKSVSGNIAGFVGAENFNVIELIRVVVRESQAVTGGVIYSNRNNSFLLESCEFYDSNSTKESGMFGTWTLNYIIIKNSIFRNSYSVASGFTYLISFNTFGIENCSFLNFKSNDFGGVIGTSQSNVLRIKNATFANSYCAGSAGTILLQTDSQAYIENSVFINSSAGLVGGVMVISSQNLVVVIKGCQFLNTSASNNIGGLFFILNGNNLTMEDCIIDNSTVTVHGSGGVFSVSSKNTMNMRNNTYKNCRSPASGGILNMALNNNYSEDSSAFINISIINTESFLHDGAVFQLGNQNMMTLTNCVFANISSQNSGGIIYLGLLNRVYLLSSRIFTASVQFAGALLYAEEQNYCMISEMQLERLTGNLFGTGIYLLFTNVLLIENSVLSNISNTGAAGGLAYFKDSNQINLTNNVISDIWTGTTGGFLFAEINNSFVMGNLSVGKVKSGNSGGIFYISRNNNLSLEESSLSDIESGFRGAVIFAIGNNDIKFSFVNISTVRSLDYGQFFYLTSLNKMKISGSLLNDSNCYKSPGSAIYLADGNIFSLINSVIQNFQVISDVDYFYGESSNTVSLENCTISTQFSQMFLDLNSNHTVNLSGIHVLQNSSFNTFIVVKKSSLKIRSLSMKFNIHHAVFHATDNSILDIRKSQILPANVPSYAPTSLTQNSSNSVASSIDFQSMFKDFLIIYIQNSKLVLKKSSFQNTLNISLSLLASINSSVLIKECLVFGMSKTQSGAVADLFNSNLKLSKNVIFQSKALSGGCVYMNFSDYPLNLVSQSTQNNSRILQQSNQSEALALNISRNTFKRNRARLQGGALMLAIPPKLEMPFALGFNNFEENSAWVGGALHFENASLGKLANNTFMKNKAIKGNFTWNDSKTLYYAFDNNSQAKGGGIHTVGVTGIQSEGNVYSNNQADIGGAIYSSKPIISQNDTFNDNSAIFYGNDRASLVKNLTFLLNESLYDSATPFQVITYAEMVNVISGGITTVDPNSDCLLRIAGMDDFSNIVFNSDQEDPYASMITYDVSSLINNKYQSNLLTSITNGQLCILGAQQNQLPLAVPFLFYFKLNGINTGLTLSLSFRDCQIGERLTDDYRCVECTPGYYSFQTVFTESSICKPCTESEPFICLGGNRLSPKPGYWRSDSSSKNFLKCPKNNACVPYNLTLYEEAMASTDLSALANDLSAVAELGGVTNLFFTGNCEIGFSGPFCNSCDDEYGKMGKMNCILCAESSWFYYLLIILQIVLKIWYLFYCVLMAFKMIIAITLKNASEGAVVAINMLKILVIHIQILSFILKMPLDWSDNLRTYLPILFSFSPDISESFNFECFMKSLGWRLSEQYFILILCPVYIILIFIISLIFVGARKKSSKMAIKALSNLKLGLCVFFIIIILTYIDLSKVNLEMFQCLNISDPSSPDYRLVNDVSVICDSILHDLWKYIVAVPVLFLCVLLVVFIVGKLTISFFRGDLDARYTKLEFGYFYYAYKRKYYYWDFVILMRRLLILFFFLFFYEELTSKSVFPILLMVLTLFLSLTFQIFVHPFEKEFELVNDAEQYSLITLCLSYMIMLMYATFYFHNYEIPESLFLLTTLSIFFANVAYFFYWVRNYYVFYFSKKMKTFVQAIRNTIRADGVVWLERLQKEHHIIFKFHNYFFKKQYLLGDISEQTQEFNAFFSEAEKGELGLSSVYAKVMAKALRSVTEQKDETKMLLKENADYFDSKEAKPKEIEALWTEPNTYKLRMNKSLLKQALFGEEITLFESPSEKFKITYKKTLKGRNFYTYQLINEIKVVGDVEGKISLYDVESKRGLNAMVEGDPPVRLDESWIYSHQFSIRIKSFTNEHDYVTFCLRIKYLEIIDV